MKLFIIRHAQSQNNALPTSQRVPDAPLTELGLTQARYLAQWAQQAPFQKLLTSPFRRTLQTSQLIYDASDVDWMTWTQLHEQGGCVSGVDAASFQGEPGMTGDAIRQEFPGCLVTADIDDQGWWKSQPRETDAQLMERVTAVKERLVTEFGAGQRNIACVTHADFSQLLISALLGDVPDHQPEERSLLNTSVTSFTIEGSSVQMDGYSNVDHLPAELVS